MAQIYSEAQRFLRRNTKPSILSGKPWRTGADPSDAIAAGAFSPSQNVWQFPDGSKIEFKFGLVAEYQKPFEIVTA